MHHPIVDCCAQDKCDENTYLSTHRQTVRAVDATLLLLLLIIIMRRKIVTTKHTPTLFVFFYEYINSTGTVVENAKIVLEVDFFTGI